MTILISADEVIQMTGIRRGTDTALLNRHLIDAVQEEYIRPILGKDLFDLLLSEVSVCIFTGLNEELWKDHVKPVLAHYVWHKALPQLHMQTTNSGIQVNMSDFANSATNEQRADLSSSVSSIADSLVEKMVRWLEDNEDQFADWSKGVEITSDINKTGGIIIPKS